MIFETKSDPLLPRPAFFVRMLKGFGLTLLIVAFSLAMGISAVFGAAGRGGRVEPLTDEDGGWRTAGSEGVADEGFVLSPRRTVTPACWACTEPAAGIASSTRKMR